MTAGENFFVTATPPSGAHVPLDVGMCVHVCCVCVRVCVCVCVFVAAFWSKECVVRRCDRPDDRFLFLCGRSLRALDFAR